MTVSAAREGLGAAFGNLAHVYGIAANLFNDEEGTVQLFIKGKVRP